MSNNTIKHLKENRDSEDHIDKIYNFKMLWNSHCKKYNIDEQPNILPSVNRIIVLGDIHGDWEMTQRLLKIAKVVDDNGNWNGGDTVVVQVGDQIDRCRYGGAGSPSCEKKEATEPDEGNDWIILKYFTKLHHQAKKFGGAVYSLMGNHEFMNVNGDFRYVSYEGRREFIDYITPSGTQFADGEEARRWAFQPGNPISDFLACTRQLALVIGSNLFVHAGIVPIIAKKYNVSSLNKLMSLYLWDVLDKSSDYSDIFFRSEVSPMWNRIYGNIGIENIKNGIEDEASKDSIDIQCNKILTPLKEIYKVDNIYVGHTPFMENGINSVCDNHIWLTDFGASKAFDKFDKSKASRNSRAETRKAQVLEILKDGKVINILS